MRRIAYALCILGALFMLWRACLSYTLETLSDTQQRLQRVQLVELDRQLNQFSFIPKLLSEDVEIRQALLTLSNEALQSANRRLQRTQRESGLDVAYLLDQTGSTIASSNWAEALSFVGVNYSFRPYFTQAIQGQGATFFAVGATTGVPGYFIAEPVTYEGEPVGVVVAKVALGVLVEAWSQLPYESLISDEFGVIILSTQAELLYTPTIALDSAQIEQLQRERRYVLQSLILKPDLDTAGKRSVSTASGSQAYRLFSQTLSTEPWKLISLVAEREIYARAGRIAVALASAVLILFLMARLYQQQRLLVLVEKRNSQELEERVQQRTRELEDAQKRLISESNFLMLGRMSAAINHEINQPLASLRLNMASLRTLIAKKEGDPEAIEQIVIDSDRTTKRIGLVISSLRSLAQQNESHFQCVAITKLVDDVIGTIGRERPALSRCVTVSSDCAGLQVLGDAVLIQQALLNLLYNAFDAVLSVECPCIILAVSVQSQHDYVSASDSTNDHNVVLSVTDNGPGVSDAVAKSLFEPFTTTRQRHDGLGLGLTIARQIAAGHGGQLTHSSATITSHIPGSCFALTLPLLSGWETQTQ